MARPCARVKRRRPTQRTPLWRPPGVLSGRCLPLSVRFPLLSVIAAPPLLRVSENGELWWRAARTWDADGGSSAGTSISGRPLLERESRDTLGERVDADLRTPYPPS